MGTPDHGRALPPQQHITIDDRMVMRLILKDWFK
jgi:hypothetical protein